MRASLPVTWASRVAFPTRSTGPSQLAPLRVSGRSPTDAGFAASLFLTVIRAYVKGDRQITSYREASE